MHVKLHQHVWHIVTTITDCRIETPNGVIINLPGGIQHPYFADGTSFELFGAATVRRDPLFGLSSTAELDGLMESDLHVGHGAADAVPAVCTLTLGDLGTGGTLTDGATTLELDPPDESAGGSTKAEGWVPIADATAAGSVTFGEHDPVVFDESVGEYATGMFCVMPGATILVSGGIEVEAPSSGSVDEFNEAFEAAGAGIVCTAVDAHGEFDVYVRAERAGVDGNSITIDVAGSDTVTLSGGTPGTRTVFDIAGTLAELDYISAVLVDADEQGMRITAAHAGVNDRIAVEGELFGDQRPPTGMEGGLLSYTKDELISAINAKTALAVTAAATETEGTITLTANTPGAAANSITYTATGCFGGGTVKQGSTTRGRNAVEQTDFEIVLNGNQPRPLVGGEHATAMKNGGVYTVAAAGTSLEFLNVTIADYATAEIWVACTATTTVTWPESWSWVDGVVPPCQAGNRYFVRVWSDGHAVVAELKYSYTNA